MSGLTARWARYRSPKPVGSRSSHAIRKTFDRRRQGSRDRSFASSSSSRTRSISFVVAVHRWWTRRKDCPAGNGSATPKARIVLALGDARPPRISQLEARWSRELVVGARFRNPIANQA